MKLIPIPAQRQSLDRAAFCQEDSAIFFEHQMTIDGKCPWCLGSGFEWLSKWLNRREE